MSRNCGAPSKTTVSRRRGLLLKINTNSASKKQQKIEWPLQCRLVVDWAQFGSPINPFPISSIFFQTLCLVCSLFFFPQRLWEMGPLTLQNCLIQLNLMVYLQISAPNRQTATFMIQQNSDSGSSI